MKDTSFFRMQLAMQDNGLASFETNLGRMIAMIIFVSGRRLSVEEIRKELATNYELTFTDEEIIKSIEKKRSGIIKEENISKIERHGEYFENYEVLYKLDDETWNKLNDRQKDIDNISIIHQFTRYASDEGVLIDEESFRNLLNKFLYFVFNTNKETLITFLTKKNGPSSSIIPLKLTEDEKRDINLFLNWENKEKDLFVYKTVSYCVEYCMLTVKKGGENYKNIFAGKKFYLDTNVILRLAGINNEERKSVIKAFIDKCTENGIRIYYTNFTYKEIEETLNYNIKAIKNLLRGHRMVNKNHIVYYSQPHTNLDFINIYDEWAKRNSNKYNDFDAFKKYLMNIIKDILKRFEKVDGISNEKINMEEYKLLNESLTSYKAQRHAKTYAKSINIDVENYMFIKYMRSKGRVDSFYDIKEFLISTDGNLCDWGKEISPGSTPIVVLPSVWYSLLLKLQGRTADDFKAFNLFLNQRYKMEYDELGNIKADILDIIQNLDEPVDIKDLMLEEIKNRLEENPEEMVQPVEIIEQAKESVINKIAQEIYSEKKELVVSDTKKRTEVETIIKIAEAKAESNQNFVRILKNLSNWFRIAVVIVSFFILANVLMKNKELMSNWDDLIEIIKTESVSFWKALLVFLSQFLIEPAINIYSNNHSFERVKEKEYKRLKNTLKE